MSLSSADDVIDWVYVGEGNQNLVVRYIGKDPFFVSVFFEANSFLELLITV